jgi:hypothetical protein
VVLGNGRFAAAWLELEPDEELAVGAGGTARRVAERRRKEKRREENRRKATGGLE